MKKKNHQSLRALFDVKKNGEIVGFIEPGKNYYLVSKIITTEAGIFHDWLQDIYITIGNETENVWFIKVYLNPLVSFIWIGVFIMVFSGIVAIFKK